jgi:integrase
VTESARERSAGFAGEDASEGSSVAAFWHAAATATLEGGANIRFVQAFLGHAKLTTTRFILKTTSAAELRQPRRWGDNRSRHRRPLESRPAVGGLQGPSWIGMTAR